MSAAFSEKPTIEERLRPHLCRCPAPLWEADPLRCSLCGRWIPQGDLPSRERVAILAREATSILAKLADDYAWAHSVSFTPPRRRNGEGRVAGVADPAGNAVADPVRLAVRDNTAAAARLLERTIRVLRAADELMGDALFAAEPPGPADHTPAPFHDPHTLYPGRPDLAEAHAAQARRRARGEGIPQ